MKEFKGIAYMLVGLYGLFLSGCYILTESLINMYKLEIMISVFWLILFIALCAICVTVFIYGYYLINLNDMLKNEEEIKKERNSRNG